MGWTRFFRRSQYDAERARELEDYLAHEIDDNIARGMTADEARRAAHRRLGNPTLIREEIYEMNTVHIVDSAWQDVRFGARLLLKNRTFSIVAVLTLALGTGANAAIFQLVSAVRMRPLPVERPDALVSLGINTNDKGRTGRFMSRRPFFSEPLYRAIHDGQQGFTHVMAWGITTWNTATDGEYRPVQGLLVNGQFFDGLGVRAGIGRLIGGADDQAGCGSPGAVLSHDYWQTRYGGEAGVLGQTVILDGRPFDIIGVTPASFFGTEVGRSFDVAVPLCAEPIFREAQSGLGEARHLVPGSHGTTQTRLDGRARPGADEQRNRFRQESSAPSSRRATAPRPPRITRPSNSPRRQLRPASRDCAAAMRRSCGSC